MTTGSFKVGYDNGKTAYLDDNELPDGSYTGVDKHTDEPVRLIWDDDAGDWKKV